MSNIALILSGGVGLRLASDIPKQYIKVNGKMIISYCLDTFLSNDNVDGICIVADENYIDAILSDIDMPIGSSDIALNITFATPGATRQLSILNGLNAIKTLYGDDCCVIIHDAARPNLTSEYIDMCLNAVIGHDGVMPALPMKDTIYISNDGYTISSLIDRSTIFAGQAPEVYYLNKYLSACNALLPDDILKINGSTEPAIIAGLDVVIIPGDDNNYKITTAADLERFSDSLKKNC